MKRILFFLSVLTASLSGWGQDAIINHTGFTLSYSCEHCTASWVSWTLTKAHVCLADEPRSSTFHADPMVPSVYRVTPSDYANTGYDRGHLCPAADMSWSKQAMHDCFYMSNMCPQVPELNRVSWKALETACRKWVLTEDTLYIVCGPVYGKGPISKIGSSTRQVDVPDGFYKVILSLRNGHQKAIGFYYRNTGEKQSLQSTFTTVDDIETLTGIDFFHHLPAPLEQHLESHSNLHDWK